MAVVGKRGKGSEISEGSETLVDWRKIKNYIQIFEIIVDYWGLFVNYVMLILFYFHMIKNLNQII